MPKELRLVAPLHQTSGYAKAGRALLATALQAGYRVQAHELECTLTRSLRVDGTVREARIPAFPCLPIPDVQRKEMQAALATDVAADAPTLLLGHPTSNFDWVPGTGPRLLLTMQETDRLPPAWKTALQNADLVVAPSEFCQETFCRAGFDAKLLPLPSDERLWQPFPLERIGKGVFTFFSLFSVCERKNWRKLMQAFAEEFAGEDARLLCKCNHPTDVEELAKWCRASGADVKVLGGTLSDSELRDLYQTSDCFVLPSCEGFGMTYIEAALCGTPSIALEQGGAADIVTETTGYPVPSYWEPAVGNNTHYYPSSHLTATCTVKDLREVMRQAYAELSGTERKGGGTGLARRTALCRFSTQALKRSLGQIIESAQTHAVPRPLSPAPPLTVIVTSHNAREKTQRCLTALREHTPQAHILLADDGDDGTAEWAVEQGFVVLRQAFHGNVSAKRNAALRYAEKGECVAFVDNDCYVGRDWWETLAGVLAAYPRLGMLAAKQVNPDSSVRNLGMRLLTDGTTSPILLERPVVYADYVEWPCVVVRPEVWQALPLDEAFPLWYDDVDYCCRVRNAGWDVAATNLVTVIHDANTTSAGRRDELPARRAQFLRKWKEALR